MNQYTIGVGPRAASGEVEIALPPSKSIFNRLLIMEALSGGKVHIPDLPFSDDTGVLKALLYSREGESYLAHAGTALRFGLAWAALTAGSRILSGSPRLRERPIAPLVDALRQMGANITYLDREGFAPLQVTGGGLRGRVLHLDASVSSQFITALMLIGPYLEGGLDIYLTGTIVSAPYLHMTASLMKRAGAEAKVEGNYIRVEAQPYSDAVMAVEPDWSAASYFYSVAALAPGLSIAMPGLTADTVQGDAVVADIFTHFGVSTHFTPRGAVVVADRAPDQKFNTYDFTHCPDLAQTVAVTAAGLQLPFTLTGLSTLRVKETDRIAALAKELGKCGVHCATGPDFLQLNSFNASANPYIHTYHDHRMAMAFAPLALRLGTMAVGDAGVVTKSFPEFWREMGKVLHVESMKQ